MDGRKRITCVYASARSPFIVLRTILGFTPSEWADVTTERAGVASTRAQLAPWIVAIRVAPMVPFKDGDR